MSQSQPLSVFAVRPKKACEVLGCGNTHLYQLIAAGELKSFKDGRARKVLVISIYEYIERQLKKAKNR